jgi:hypothetical protein
MDVNISWEIPKYSVEYTKEQMEELRKCTNSFPYFCEEYIKIIHPMKGLIPFKLYPFQERVINNYDQFKYNIVSKFRQAGLTTVTVIWSLWRCLFRTDQRIMVVCKSDRESIGIGKIAQHAKDNLPDWMQPLMGNDNDHEKEFKDTGSVIWFFTVQGVRSRALTYLIIDEAAFITSMDEHWKALYPTLSTGGSCIVISTVNGVGNWYEETYTKAQDKKNEFNIIDLDYTEHPDYNSPEWAKRTRGNLGERAFQQEILRNFLGSGSTYINPETISRLSKQVKYPIRKLLPEWDSSQEEDLEKEESTKSTKNKKDDPSKYNNAYERGALWVWREPEKNREYILCADGADGGGGECDNSAFSVFDIKTLEQVAEFYSNIIPVHKFSQVIAQTATFYNGALAIVENAGAGASVLNRLEHTIFYENLYFTPGINKEKAGLVMSKNNRPLILETFQTCLMSSLVKINSIRIVREMRTFVFNRQKQRAEAQKGKHDDLILATAIGLYVMDVLNRQMPIGANDLVHNAITESFKDASFDQIKKMLEEGLPDDAFAEEPTYEDLMPKLNGRLVRPMDKLLKSFGF